MRQIPVTEVKEAAKQGELKEIFGSGTAAVVSPIIGFSHGGEKFELEKLENSYASLFKQKLMNIQYNKAEDKYNWRVKI